MSFGLLLQINNAAIASTEIGDTFEDAKSLLDTNYFGVKNVTKALLPLARNTPGGFRVVVSASVGQLKVTTNWIHDIDKQNSSGFLQT
jgi:carbonyl reductase 1